MTNELYSIRIVSGRNPEILIFQSGNNTEIWADLQEWWEANRVVICPKCGEEFCSGETVFSKVEKTNNIINVGYYEPPNPPKNLVPPDEREE